jgi:hypothetical protein
MAQQRKQQLPTAGTRFQIARGITKPKPLRDQMFSLMVRLMGLTEHEHLNRLQINGDEPQWFLVFWVAAP